MISVILPTLDRPQMLARAVGSVLAQTHTHWELVVYNVGDSVAVPDDPRIRYIEGTRAGPAADFQAALDHATGDIVTPLADDDWLPAHALETAVREFGDAQWLNGQTVIVNGDGYPGAIRGGTTGYLADTRSGRYMLGGAIYWRKALTDRLGGFNTSFDGAADFDLYLRFAKDSDPKLVREVIYVYVDHAETDSRVNQARQAEASARVAAAV